MIKKMEETAYGKKQRRRGYPMSQTQMREMLLRNQDASFEHGQNSINETRIPTQGLRRENLRRLAVEERFW